MDIRQEAIRVQELHGLSDRQFAIQLGIHPSGWSRIKRGQKPLGMKFLNALVREFPELRLAAFEYLGSHENHQ